MKLKVVYLGRIKEITSKSEEHIDLPSVSYLNEFSRYIQNCYPDIDKHIFRIAVNRNIEDENIELQENDEIAFLPAFAGG